MGRKRNDGKGSGDILAQKKEGVLEWLGGYDDPVGLIHEASGGVYSRSQANHLVDRIVEKRSSKAVWVWLDLLRRVYAGDSNAAGDSGDRCSEAGRLDVSRVNMPVVADAGFVAAEPADVSPAHQRWLGEMVARYKNGWMWAMVDGETWKWRRRPGVDRVFISGHIYVIGGGGGMSRDAAGLSK